MERKKICPVCHGLAAVLDGDPEKYGDRAMDYHRFIATKYCCQECRDIMSGQQKRLSNMYRKRDRREYQRTALDAINALKERVSLLERENRASRQYIAELEKKLSEAL